MRLYAIVVLRSVSSLIKVCYISYSDGECISQIEPRLYSATQARYKVAAVGFENPQHLENTIILDSR